MLPFSACAARMQALTPRLMPGQTLVASFSTEPDSASFDGAPLIVFPYRDSWRAVTPLSLSARPGAHTLRAVIRGEAASAAVTVLARRDAMIDLPVPTKLAQTPKQLVRSLATTNTSINSAVTAVGTTILFATPFGLPLADNRRISSPFGEVRKTGEERIVHLGTDFSARRGAPVGAINAGTAIAAYADPTYGNSVIIDHGRGIYSLYLHLDSIVVARGESVRKGSLIGTVGDSGMASGVHLHLSVKIRGQSVDPIQFVSAFR